MKRKYLLAVLIATAMPLTSMAQDDDLYFNPKKEAKEKAERRALLQRQYAEQRARRDSVYRLFWSGSDRSVDEYNRGGRIFSHYENVGKDSLGNDIIQFHVGKGVAPDSIYDDAYFAQKYADRDEDFVRTREMSRWDGFYDPWFYDYYGYGPYYWRSRMWGWHNPWYWGGPVIGHVSYGGRNSGGYAGSRTYRYNGDKGYAGNSTYRSNRNRNFGGRINDNGRYNSVRNNNTNNFDRSNFGGFGNRSGASFGGGSHSGGGSFGGGGGSFGGGSRSGGGGFGGRR